MIILTISNTNPIFKINPNKDNINDKDNLHRCAIVWCPHQSSNLSDGSPAPSPSGNVINIHDSTFSFQILLIL